MSFISSVIWIRKAKISLKALFFRTNVGLFGLLGLYGQWWSIVDSKNIVFDLKKRVIFRKDIRAKIAYFF